MTHVKPTKIQSLTRREALAAAGGLSAVLVLRPAHAQVAPASSAARGLAIRAIVGDAAVTPGKVTLDVPPLSENGNTVAMTVSVDSPMTPQDYVKAIHVFTDKNPLPNVISVQVGPRAGRAVVQTRIRLADTQDVTAIAAMSDGSFWSDTATVIITLGACSEETP